MKERQNNDRPKQEHLIKTRLDSINSYDNENESENVEMEDMEINTIMGSLTDEKVDELYEIYLQSKLECLEKCEQLGLIDECVEELFALFERFKAI